MSKDHIGSLHTVLPGVPLEVGIMLLERSEAADLVLNDWLLRAGHPRAVQNPEAVQGVMGWLRISEAMVFASASALSSGAALSGFRSAAENLSIAAHRATHTAGDFSETVRQMNAWWDARHPQPADLPWATPPRPRSIGIDLAWLVTAGAHPTR